MRPLARRVEVMIISGANRCDSLALLARVHGVAEQTIITIAAELEGYHVSVLEIG